MTDPLDYVIAETDAALGAAGKGTDLDKQTQDILDLCDAIIEKTNETAELIKSMRVALDGGGVRSRHYSGVLRVNQPD